MIRINNVKVPLDMVDYRQVISQQLNISKKEIIKALAVAGVFGNVIKANATISGADGGCQAEIGSACSMAAAGYGWILELNNNLIQYAAEMGLEHNLGLTCDPVGGYVQIPCIERNGFGALRAMDAAMYAKQLGYLRKNKVSFDAVVRVMKQTGKDLNSLIDVYLEEENTIQNEVNGLGYAINYLMDLNSFNEEQQSKRILYNYLILLNIAKMQKVDLF